MKATRNILIADDDIDDIELLEICISNILSSYKASHAIDGSQCVRFLENNPTPDYIFLDINMPRKNGIDCLRWIRANSAFEQVPVIITSTSCNCTDVNTCYTLGANFYVVKGTNLSKMTVLLNQCLRH